MLSSTCRAKESTLLWKVIKASGLIIWVVISFFIAAAKAKTLGEFFLGLFILIFLVPTSMAAILAIVVVAGIGIWCALQEFVTKDVF